MSNRFLSGSRRKQAPAQIFPSEPQAEPVEAPAAEETLEAEPELELEPEPELETEDTPVPNSDAAARELAQLRSLLLGQDTSRADEQVQALREDVDRRFAELQTALREELRTFESILKEQLKSIGQRVDTEQSERREEMTRVVGEVEAVAKAVEQQLRAFDLRGKNTHTSLREELLTQAGQLSEAVREKHAEISGRVDRTLEELRTLSGGRDTLAQALREVADRIAEGEDQGS